MGRFEAINQRRAFGQIAPPPAPKRVGLLAQVKAQKDPSSVQPQGPTAEEVLAARASLSGLPEVERAVKRKALLKKWRPWVVSWVQDETPVCAELISWDAVFTHDEGDFGEFLDLCHLAEKRGLAQKAIKNKSWILLRLYWLKDWCAAQKTAQDSFEPYLADEYEQLTEAQLALGGPGALPKTLIEGLDYFEFYRLLRSAFVEEDRAKQNQGLQKTLVFGQSRLEAGSPAKIKTNLTRVAEILAGATAQWDEEHWGFKASA